MKHLFLYLAVGAAVVLLLGFLTPIGTALVPQTVLSGALGAAVLGLGAVARLVFKRRAPIGAAMPAPRGLLTLPVLVVGGCLAILECTAPNFLDTTLYHTIDHASCGNLVNCGGTSLGG